MSESNGPNIASGLAVLRGFPLAAAPGGPGPEGSASLKTGHVAAGEPDLRRFAVADLGQPRRAERAGSTLAQDETSNDTGKDRAMTDTKSIATEIAFIGPAVDDIETLIAG